jgi:chromosomal replication initiation ATPase DnaA
MNAAPTGPGQLPFDYGLSPSHAAADFMVGDGNVLAHAHVMAWPAWPSPLALLVGPPSSGKSHLARIWAERAGAAEARPDTAGALAAAGGAAPLLVDDADRAGFSETALFNLLNQSMRDARPLLMTARLPVADWPYRTDDLKSRARLAAQFAMRLTDDIQLSQMFAKLFADRQVAVDPRLIAYLVTRMERSPEEAVALADMMDRMALARGTGISRAIAAEALALRRAASGRPDTGPGREGQHDDD